MMKMTSNLRQAYIKGVAGATAIVFALVIPIVVGSAGMAIDLAFAYLVKQRLSHALDAAAVAAAAASNEGGNLQAKVQEFLDKNYPEEKIGDVHDLSISQNGSKISVSARARFDTYFAKFLGVDEIDVYAETEVTREILGLEVALVLDVTGSMNNIPPAPPGNPANEVTNIQALREAATNFTNILFDSAVFDDTVKIGVIPYSTTVNVGPYGLGLDLDGSNYSDPFVNNPNNLDYYNPQAPEEAPQSTPDEDTSGEPNFWEWRGCVLARDYPDDTEDYEEGWMWDMFRHTFQYSSSSYYRYYYNYFNNQYGPNYSCNKSHILPITSDRNEILYQIAKLKGDGSTSGNIGMTWGWRVISPGFPFEEGADYNDKNWKKAVVMMTDGDNTLHPYYGAYGGYTQNDVSVTDMNERFEETCEKMKEEGILIYTITFSYPTNYDGDGNPSHYNINDNTRGYYERCATEDKYYDALGQDELRDVFEAISRELSNIHISG